MLGPVEELLGKDRSTSFIVGGYGMSVLVGLASKPFAVPPRSYTPFESYVLYLH
jgi:hypothetical protein